MRGRLCMGHGRVAGRRRRPRVVRRTERVERVVEHVRIAGGIALLEAAAAQTARHRTKTRELHTSKISNMCGAE